MWYFDGGCSKHMIGDASQSVNIKLKHDGYVPYADNNRGTILGVGTMVEKS